MTTKKKKVANVPNLRFPGFEGEWEKKKLGQVATNKSEKYNPANATGSIKCIELEHLASESGQMLGYIDGSRSGSIKNVFHQGDILFGKLRPYLRKYLQATFEGVCSSEIWVLKGTNVSNNFLYRIIQTNKFVDLANQSSGSKMPRADWNIVERGVFSFPSTEEQNKIASFLAMIDERIQTQNKIIEGLKVLKGTLSKKIFSQELRFPEFTYNWETNTLNELGDFMGGGTPLSTNDSFWNGEIPWISSSDLDENDVHTIRITRFINDEAILNSAAKLCPEPVILIVSRVGVGKVAYSEESLCTSQDFTNIINLKCNGLFLAYLLSIKMMEAASSTQGTSIKGIPSKEIKSKELSIPEQEEQQKIAKFLSIIDSKIDTEDRVLKKLDQQKKYLLDQMFV